jgi:Uma2 family endonuclease
VEEDGMVAAKRWQAAPGGWTEEAYLEMEAASAIRHERGPGGVVYALAGGTRLHSGVAAGTIIALAAALHGRPCTVDTSDLRVRLADGEYYYPDASVTCAEGKAGAGDGRQTWTERPTAIVEVLSPSTAEYDAGAKFERYATLPALRDYVLVATDRWCLEVRSRLAGGDWRVRSFGPGQVAELSGLGVRLAVADCYATVPAEWIPEPDGPPA